MTGSGSVIKQKQHTRLLGKQSGSQLMLLDSGAGSVTYVTTLVEYAMGFADCGAGGSGQSSMLREHIVSRFVSHGARGCHETAPGKAINDPVAQFGYMLPHL